MKYDLFRISSFCYNEWLTTDDRFGVTGVVWASCQQVQENLIIATWVCRINSSTVMGLGLMMSSNKQWGSCNLIDFGTLFTIRPNIILELAISEPIF